MYDSVWLSKLVKTKVSPQSKEFAEALGVLANWRDAYEKELPVVTDSTYDALYEYVKSIDPNNAFFDEVGADIENIAVEKRVSHEIPMLSMGKCLTKEMLAKWLKSPTLAKYSNKVYVVMYKLDGLSCSLIYKGGRLVKAATRGDGYIGEDITDKAKNLINGCLASISRTDCEIEVRGEIVLFRRAFNDINKMLVSKGQEPYKDLRAAVAGIIKNGDPTYLKHLNFIAYNIYNMEVSTFEQKLLALHDFLFKVVPFYAKITTYEQIETIFDELIERRAMLEYQIDGLIIQLDNLANCVDLGFTSHHPRSATALKFDAEQAETKVIGMDWTMSRNGTLTGVALVEPVLLAGAVVSRATCHNINFIDEYQVNVGNTIVIARSGDVIPKIKSFVPAKVVNTEKAIPSTCPYCGASTKVVRDVNTDVLKCTNALCFQKLACCIEHYCKATDIKNFGEVRCVLLAKHFLSCIHQYENIYQQMPTVLSVFHLYTAFADVYMGFGSSKGVADSLVQEVRKSVGIKLEKFLAGIGIPNFSENSARKFCKNAATLGKTPTFDMIIREIIASVGISDAEAIKIWYEKNNKCLDLLYNTVKPSIPAGATGIFSGRTFCITGTLSKSRPHYEEIIRSNGGDVTNTVTKTTDYLLCGADAGNKLDKATKYGVKILNELDFSVLVGGNV